MIHTDGTRTIANGAGDNLFEVVAEGTYDASTDRFVTDTDAALKRLVRERLEYIRGEIEAERVSYGELAELREFADYIEEDDLLLRQWAGIDDEDS